MSTCTWNNVTMISKINNFTLVLVTDRGAGVPGWQIPCYENQARPGITGTIIDFKKLNDDTDLPIGAMVTHATNSTLEATFKDGKLFVVLA
ncbi:hypothetical protein Dda_5584 [Drechslerella dactyloides]|uniref:Uncharacterized protein n=1 Tax=Drechslerella dactyloides TaxID=74499 RepID=A0AAD6IWC7_DREDA|nr:hypothetical protein Dda_5584 [Drechslerella dactyloides]